MNVLSLLVRSRTQRNVWCIQCTCIQCNLWSCWLGVLIDRFRCFIIIRRLIFDGVSNKQSQKSSKKRTGKRFGETKRYHFLLLYLGEFDEFDKIVCLILVWKWKNFVCHINKIIIRLIYNIIKTVSSRLR